MTVYLNLGRDSGILEYEIGEDFIIVHFGSGKYRHYKYDYTSTGMEQVERMKVLAENGQGLNEYISKCIKSNYANKW